MRLFISYARVDRLYCLKIVDLLDVHETWLDHRLYAGQNWWKEILRRLEWCEGFVYLLSPDSLASEYCRREYELAVSMGRAIIPVLIHEQVSLPDELANIQHVDLSHGITPEGVRMLLNSIHLAERQMRSQPARQPGRISSEALKPPAPEQAQVIFAAAEAMEKGQFDRAVFLLKQAKENNFKSKFIDLDVLLREALIGLQQQSLQREAEREYRQISELMKFSRTRRLGCQAFRAFQQEFPNHDPDGIADICAEMQAQVRQPAQAIGVSASAPAAAPAVTQTVPRPAPQTPQPAVRPTPQPATPVTASTGQAPAAANRPAGGVQQAPAAVNRQTGAAPASPRTPTGTTAPSPGYGSAPTATGGRSSTSLAQSLPTVAPPRPPSAVATPQPRTNGPAGPVTPPHPTPRTPAPFRLRLLQWCEIPTGPVLLGNNSQDGMAPEVVVDRFYISKYLVTNEQYQAFLDAPDGYANEQWWAFSPHARQWRAENPTSRSSKFKGDERPREMVNWFDAMAFCGWLGSKLGATVTLPTVRQWVRAARGSDSRTYPWGNKFDEDRCNTSHSRLKMTTPVTRYPNGASPFGVFDMAGNVWEWCRNPKGDDSDVPEITSAQERAVHGGSFIGPAERASIVFQYYLNPRLYFSSIGFRVVLLR